MICYSLWGLSNGSQRNHGLVAVDTAGMRLGGFFEIEPQWNQGGRRGDVETRDELVGHVSAAMERQQTTIEEAIAIAPQRNHGVAAVERRSARRSRRCGSACRNGTMAWSPWRGNVVGADQALERLAAMEPRRGRHGERPTGAST